MLSSLAGELCWGRKHPHPPSLTLASANAQVRQVGGKVAGAAGAAERGEGGLLRVQWGWERGGEVDVGQVRQGAPGVVGGRDQGCSVFLVSRWKDAGKRPDMGMVSSWMEAACSPPPQEAALVAEGGW